MTSCEPACQADAGHERGHYGTSDRMSILAVLPENVLHLGVRSAEFGTLLSPMPLGVVGCSSWGGNVKWGGLNVLMIRWLLIVK